MGIKFCIAFVAGAFLMLALSFSVYRKSYYYKKAMAEAGTSLGKAGIASRLVTLAIFIAMILFLALFDAWVLSGGPRSFASLFALNLALAAALSLFDALFIDLFLLVIWRPGVLRLPEGQPTRDAMLRHVKLQFTAGWIFKVPLAVLAAAFSSALGGGVL